MSVHQADGGGVGRRHARLRTHKMQSECPKQFQCSFSPNLLSPASLRPPA